MTDPGLPTISPPLPQSADETSALIVKAQQGDRKALEWLVRQNQRKVYATLAQLLPERQDVADLAQDALIRMCRGLVNLKNPATFKVWLNRIVMNLFYDELRKRPRQLQTITLETTDDEASDSGLGQTRDIADEKAQTELSADRRELADQLNLALEKLEEPFRSAIVLREVQGLSYEEIAETMQTSLGTVKSRIARARLKLQQILRPYLNPK
ncbi:MAG: sigma-70 family RNA polymerase sigma factor [Vampirovibrionales bacterium]|nr:sigma-70 family RNA polymerase sigma factor [Vampirovibrionales bacterium]